MKKDHSLLFAAVSVLLAVATLAGILVYRDAASRHAWFEARVLLSDAAADRARTVDAALAIAPEPSPLSVAGRFFKGGAGHIVFILLDADGAVCFQNDETRAFQKIDPTSFAEEAYSEALWGGFTAPDGSLWHGALVQTGGEGFSVLCAIPDATVYASARENIRVFLLLTFALLLCASLGVLAVILREERARRALAAKQEKTHQALLREQERLRVSEEEYRIAAQQSDKHVLRYDIALRTSYLSESLCQLFDLPPMIANAPYEALGTGLIAKECESNYVAFYEKLLSGARTAHTENLMRRKDGLYRWFHGDATMVCGDDGRPLHAVISFSDVTDRREKQLAYDKWRQSVDALPRAQIALLEFDAMTGAVERVEGGLAQRYFDGEAPGYDELIRRFTRVGVCAEDALRVSRLLSRQRLLAAFGQGETDAQMEFRTEDERWMALSLQLVSHAGSPGIRGYLMFRDIHERKVGELRLKTLSEMDALTGVLNRQAFTDKVTAVLESLPGYKHALLMVDLDGFKAVNDTLGHAAGDRLLHETAQALKNTLREGDLIGRIGGDEFMMLMRSVPGCDIVKRRADVFLGLMRRKASDTVSISGSLGIAMYPQDGRDFDELYHCADRNMYHVKQNGKDGFELRDDTIKGTDA